MTDVQADHPAPDPRPAPGSPPWPAPFKTMHIHRRLVVPCPGAVPADVRPTGAVARRGDALAHLGHASGPGPLAPADGKVTGLRSAPLFDGREVAAVELEAESTQAVQGQPTPPPAESSRRGLSERVLAALAPVTSADLGTWIEQLRLGGVWADRWTSPDLMGQLHDALRRPPDTVVCNALDIDAALALNGALFAACPAELIAGVALLARATGAGQTWLVHDANAGADLPAAVADLARAANVRLVPARGDYPQAHPTLVLHHHLERPLRPGQLPTTRGVLLLDAAAAVAVGRRFLHGEPMLTVPLALFDGARRAAHFVSAPVGASLSDLFAAVGTSAANLALCGGGPMRDLRLTGEVVASGNELTAYALRPRPAHAAEPCLRCGWCIDHCPVRIHPAGILEAAQREGRALAEANGLGACIECGICSYVCPSHLPLLPGIRMVRYGGAGNDE